MQNENDSEQTDKRPATVDSGGQDAFGENPAPYFSKAIWVLLVVVVLMLALPFAMLGWVARDYFGSGNEKRPAEQESAGDFSEATQALRQTLERSVDAKFSEGGGGTVGGLAGVEIQVFVERGSLAAVASSVVAGLREASLPVLEAGPAERKTGELPLQERFLVSVPPKTLLLLLSEKLGTGGGMVVKNWKNQGEAQLVELVVSEKK